MDAGEAVRDERADRAPDASPGEASSHHADNIWVGMGIHGPAPNGLHHRKRKRRARNGTHHRSKGHRHAPPVRPQRSSYSGGSAQLTKEGTQILDPAEEDAKQKKSLAPGQRIQFLLHPEDEDGEGEDGDDEAAQHPLFTEMSELHNDEWRETARWVKFEEDVEEGGNRWSKPHVATLSLHSLFELRSLLMNGCVILDMEATQLPQIVELMLDKMVAAHQVEFQFRDEVRDAILRRHTHQYEHAKHHGAHGSGLSHGSATGQSTGFLSTVRSLADIGKSFSHGKNLGDKGMELSETTPSGFASKKISTPTGPTVGASSKAGDTQLNLPKVGSFPKELGRSESHASDFHSKEVGGLKSKKSVANFFRSSSRPFLHSASDANLASKGKKKGKTTFAVGTGEDDEDAAKSRAESGLEEGSKPRASSTPKEKLGASSSFLRAHLPSFHNDKGFEHSPNPSAADLMHRVASYAQEHMPHLPHHMHDYYEGNQHFMKKLPVGSEASNVLIGEVEFLAHHASAFIRLKTPTLLGDLTEVPVPTRFLFILLGPTGHGAQFREIGRAIATLMSDEIFHDVAYKARNRADLLDGIDEFLDQVTVLPPGEWDPDIRIEPPSSIPSQEKRKHVGEDKTGGAGSGGGGGDDNGDEEVKEEEGGHGNDPALKRTGRLFGGLIMDIKRKAPFYASDFKDALNMQCFATFIFMYFALLAPIVTFGGLLSEATGKNMAAMENLLSGAICGISYHLFSGQPLTIIGSTGPVLVFETIIYETCKELKLEYMPVRWWINLWMAVILMGMVATDASALVSYITRFTEESFATLIAIIFVYEAIVKLVALLDRADVITYFGPAGWEVSEMTQPFNSCICTGSSENFTNFDKLQKIANNKKIADMSGQSWYKENFYVDLKKNVSVKYASIDLDTVPLKYCEAFHGELEGQECYPMTDVFLLSALLMIGTFFIAFTLKRCKNSCYFPTKVRQTLSDFAVIIAIGVMAAVDYAFGLDTPKLYVPETFQPTSPDRGWIIHPFGSNPWWTMLLAIPPALLGCVLIFMDQQITAVIVNRKENKLKKKCGYHLDLFVLSILILITGMLGLPIYVAATVLSINHVNALGVESESRAPGEKPTFIGVREQRVTGILTFIFIGLSVLMTKVLKFISMPVLYGVFMYMGIMALNGIQLIDRLLLILMPMKYQPDYMYLRNVPIRRVHLFTFFQMTCLILLWVIKSIKKTKIAFPVMLVVMIAVRKLMEYVFSMEELQALDDQMPEFHLRKKADKEKKKKQKEDAADADEEDDEVPELRAVKTEGHLHIPMASGNVMKIPLSSINEETSKASSLCVTNAPLNISEGIKGSGMWKHIESESSFKIPPHESPPQRKSPPKEAAEDDDDEFAPITIKIEGSTRSNPKKDVWSLGLLAVLAIGLDVCLAGNNTITDEVYFDMGCPVVIAVHDQVYFDIKVEGRGQGKPSWTGRIVIGVFGDAMPMTGFNFVSLAKGWKHVNSGHLWGYKNCIFHRVVPDFLIQTGDIVYNDGRGGRAIYAPYFIDENHFHSHRAGGFVAMANTGFDTNNSQFYITLARARWLDGKNVVFGKVVQGFEVVSKVSELETNDKGTPNQTVRIVDAGLLPLKKPYDLTDEQLDSSKDIKRGPSAP